MASTTNKVRYGLSRVHYALYDEDNRTYGTPKTLAGAVNITFDNEGSQNNFYADNVIYYTSNSSASDTGSLELSDMTDEAMIDLLGYIRDDTTGVLYEPTTAIYPTFALLYQIEGDGNVMRGVRYNVKLSRPSEEAGTTSDSVEPNTKTLNYTASGRDFTIDGEPVNVLKSHITNAGDDLATFNAWFTQVVIPGTAVTTTNPGNTGTGNTGTGNTGTGNTGTGNTTNP